jgi:hypothetical protein
MCRPASFIVTENRVLWHPNSDSHEDIIELYGIRDDGRKCDFVRVEILPPEGNILLPLDKWRYRTDRDVVPGWYDPREAEIAVRAELPKWYEAKCIHVPEGETLVIGAGIVRHILSGKASVRARGSGWFYDRAMGVVEQGGCGIFYGEAVGDVEGGGVGHFRAHAVGTVRAGGRGYFHGRAKGTIHKGGSGIFTGLARRVKNV